MANQTLISVSDFMPAFARYLCDNGLIIVEAAQLEEGKQVAQRELRRRCLRKTTLTFKEVLDAGFLPLTSKQGIENWIKSGKIKENEVLRPAKGQRKLLTSALVRLGCTE